MDVLVAERSEFHRNGLKWMLHNSGLAIDEYTELSTADEFITEINRGQYDLMIIDVDMLRENDWRKLSSITDNSILIGTTEIKDFQTAVRCMEVRFSRLFIKPINIQNLMKTLNELVEKKKEETMKDTQSEMEKAKKHWVEKLISGEVTHLKEIWDQALQLGYQSLPTVVITAQISRLNQQMRNKSDLWKKKVLSQLYGLIERFCKSHRLISASVNDEFVILYIPKKGEQKKETINIVKSLGNQLLEWVKNESGHALYIAIGSEYKDPMNLYHSYHEAKQLQSLQFYFSQGKVSHYSDYPDLFRKEVVEQSEVPLTSDEVKDDNIQFLFHHLERNLKEWKMKGVNPIYYKLTLIFILKELLNKYQKSEKERFKSFLKYSENILNSQSVDEIFPAIKEYFMELSDSKAFNIHHLVVERALEFIHKNYMRSITLDEVSEEVSRSPYYFSHLFKKVMNMTFVEYLTHLRIKKAKELLLEDDLTVGEIASMVGYQDPNYFSRVFKAISGDSPKQWKTQKNLERTRN